MGVRRGAGGRRGRRPHRPPRVRPLRGGGPGRTLPFRAPSPGPARAEGHRAAPIPTTAPAGASAAPTSTPSAGCGGDFSEAPDFVVHAWTEDHVVRTLAWAAEHGVTVTPVGGGTSVVGGLGSGRIALHLGHMDQVAGGRPGLPGRAHPGGRGRPGARGAARQARADDALLPAVVRALDAGRLDRHARRRALRVRPDAHRRPRGGRARDHAGAGRLALAAAARLGRRAVPRPHAARQRGDARA